MVPSWHENLMGLSNSKNQNSMHLVPYHGTSRGNISV